MALAYGRSEAKEWAKEHLKGLEAVIFPSFTPDLTELDEEGRPKFAYGRIIHENCERRPHFDAGRFAQAYGDAGHAHRTARLDNAGHDRAFAGETPASASPLSFSTIRLNAGEDTDVTFLGIGPRPGRLPQPSPTVRSGVAQSLAPRCQGYC